MRQGTTPTITVNTDVDISQYASVVLTVQDAVGKQVNLNKASMTFNGTMFTAQLTQEQTLGFAKGVLILQVRAVDNAGNAIASNFMYGSINEVLNKVVIA